MENGEIYEYLSRMRAFLYQERNRLLDILCDKGFLDKSQGTVLNSIEHDIDHVESMLADLEDENDETLHRLRALVQKYKHLA